MSAISSLHGFDAASGRTRTASPFQHLYDQIDVLRRQTGTAVVNGTLSVPHGGEIATRLAEIEKTVENAEVSRSLSRGDIRQVGETLHDIRQEIVRASRAAADAAKDSKPAANRPNGLDISV